MKKRFLVFLLILGLTTAPAALAQKPKPAKQPQATVKTSPLNTKTAAEVPFVTKTLSNGMEIIVLRDSAVPIVTVELAVRNGSFTEPPELNGLSHLYEHMFFKTNLPMKRIIEGKPLPSDEYLFDIGKLGITYNGTTREEVVNYYFTTTSQFMPQAMRVVRDGVREPAFDEEEFAREIEVVIGEMDRFESQPFFYLDRALKDKLFYKYPTRKNPLGTRETVQKATTEQMRLIQARYYVPNNSALIVTGDVEPEKVFQTAQELFGDWEPTPDPFKRFPLVEHPPLPKSEGVILEKPVENVFVQIGWHGPSVGKDDAGTYAADVFSYILQQPNSRFQRKLVDSGLAQGVSIGYYTQRNVGPIQVTLVTTPDKARVALKALYAEITAFNDPKYFTDEQLESAKNLLAASDLYDREKPSEYAHTLGFWWSSTGIEYFRGYQKNLRATSRADISRYVKTYIENKPHVGVAMISPVAQAEIKLTPEELIGK